MGYCELIYPDAFQKYLKAGDEAVERRLAGNRLEAYLPLTDARAVKALFNHPAPLYFCRETVEYGDDPNVLRFLNTEAPSLAFYGPIREAAVSLLQKRQYTLEERLALLYDFGEICGRRAFEGRWSDLKKAVGEYEAVIPAHRLPELKTARSRNEAAGTCLDLFLDFLDGMGEDADPIWASLLEEMAAEEEEAVLMERLAKAHRARKAWEPLAFTEHLAVCLLFQSGAPFAFYDRLDRDMGWFVRYFALLDFLLSAAFMGKDGEQKFPAILAAFCREMFFCQDVPIGLQQAPVWDYLSFEQ